MKFPFNSRDVILLLFEEFNVSLPFVSSVTQWLDFPAGMIGKFSTELLRVEAGGIEFLFTCVIDDVPRAAIFTICIDSFFFAENGFSRLGLRQLFRKIGCEEKYVLIASGPTLAEITTTDKFNYIFPLDKLQNYFASNGNARGKFIAAAISEK